MTDNIIGRQIRAARKRKHLSGKELADKAGLDPSHISRIERGERDPSYAVLYELASILDITFLIPGRPPAESAIDADDPVEGLVHSLRYIMELIHDSIDRMESIQQAQRDDLETINRITDRLLSE